MRTLLKVHDYRIGRSKISYVTDNGVAIFKKILMK